MKYKATLCDDSKVACDANSINKFLIGWEGAVHLCLSQAGYQCNSLVDITVQLVGQIAHPRTCDKVVGPHDVFSREVTIGIESTLDMFCHVFAIVVSSNFFFFTRQNFKIGIIL